MRYSISILAFVAAFFSKNFEIVLFILIYWVGSYVFNKSIKEFYCKRRFAKKIKEVHSSLGGDWRVLVLENVEDYPKDIVLLGPLNRDVKIIRCSSYDCLSFSDPEDFKVSEVKVIKPLPERIIQPTCEVEIVGLGRSRKYIIVGQETLDLLLALNYHKKIDG